jgi:aspartyl-tRNA(Asn)/glutamyl-tRNA(Gln) amidotransferase subunit A
MTEPDAAVQQLTVAQAARALRDGAVTSRQLVEHVLNRASVLDAELGVFLATFDEAALAAADEADAALSRGRPESPLHGIPLGIKDILATREGVTTAQSLVRPSDGFAGRDAQVVAMLRSAGAIVVGKTTMAEYAMGIPDKSKPFPIPRNPWDPRAWTGGSSSGTAGGIAGGLFLAGIGSDTGGSIRLPAAMCGITGFKPTYASVSTSGSLSMAESMDTIGPMARTAEDCALIWQVIADRASSADQPVAGQGRNGDRTGSALRGLRIGVADLRVESWQIDPDQPARFDVAVECLAAAGARITPVRLPLYPEISAAGLVAQTTEAWTLHRSGLKDRWQDYAQSSRLFLSEGAFYTAADYLQAQTVRRVGRRLVERLFGDVDLIVMPTTMTPAPYLAELDPYATRATAGCFHTRYWSALGNPAISVPIGINRSGLPLGMQLAGRVRDDRGVLDAACAFQEMTDWHRQRPTLATEPGARAGSADRQDSLRDAPASVGDQVPSGRPRAGYADSPVLHGNFEIHSPAVPEADASTAHALLDACGIRPDPRELQALVAAYSLARGRADQLSSLREARDVMWSHG